MAVDKKYQVFISSTYTDLIEERREVQKALLELDCIPVGMELFPAADNDQWTYIKQVIDGCDYYLLIIGARYGSVTETGISYTEKEYDYAVENKIPVISFIHENPFSVPAEKFELDEEKRKKLDLFREKVQKKLCKMWKTPEELGGVVSRSLVQLMKSKPAIGYIRGDKASNPEKLLELQERIAALEEENKKLRFNKPEGTDGLAQGDDIFTINYTYMYSFSLDEKKTSYILSWNAIISIIGPSMYDECKEAILKEVLETYIKQNILPDGTVCEVRKNDFYTIISQLYALGITQRSDKKHTASDNSTYWSLTPYGQRYVLQLKAVKKDKKNEAK